MGTGSKQHADLLARTTLLGFNIYMRQITQHLENGNKYVLTKNSLKLLLENYQVFKIKLVVLKLGQEPNKKRGRDRN